MQRFTPEGDFLAPVTLSRLQTDTSARLREFPVKPSRRPQNKKILIGLQSDKIAISYTISRDKTAGDERYHAILLAEFGRKHHGLDLAKDRNTLASNGAQDPILEHCPRVIAEKHSHTSSTSEPMAKDLNPIKPWKRKTETTFPGAWGCPQRFATHKDLRRHYRSKGHMRESTESYRCRCGFLTHRKDNYMRHLRKKSGTRSCKNLVPLDSVHLPARNNRDRCPSPHKAH